MADQFFEMMWDCEQCDARELLAKTQRHCPMCGAAQDPKRRYFPEPGKEVEAKGHQYVGVDWACAYCESPNSAAAAFCVNCGGPGNGTKKVALVQEQPQQQAATPSQPASGTAVAPNEAPGATKASEPAQALSAASRSASGLPWLAAVAALITLLVLIGTSALVYSFFSKHDENVLLVEKSWSRSVDVEQFASVNSVSWCDALPTEAYQVTRTREQRSTRQVQDGEVCVDSRADVGDGTFTKRRECSPRYRSEPVFDARCSYLINRWKVMRTDRTAGSAQLAPTWPNSVLGNTLVQGNSLGAERLGRRNETYRVRLQSDRGAVWTCDLPAAVWSSLAENQTMTMKVRGTGGADCASLQAGN